MWMMACATSKTNCYESRWAVKAYQLTWHFFSSLHGHETNQLYFQEIFLSFGYIFWCILLILGCIFFFCIQVQQEVLTHCTISALSSLSSNLQRVWHIIGSYLACLSTSTITSSLGHGHRGSNDYFLTDLLSSSPWERSWHIMQLSTVWSSQ